MAPPGYAQLAADAGAPYSVTIADGAESALRIAIDAELRATHGIGGMHVHASRTELEAYTAALRDAEHPAATHLRHFLEPESTWVLRTRTLPLDRPLVMGILNLTVDSFSGDGVGPAVDGALERAEALREASADIIDAGAESARADRPVADASAEAHLVGEAVAALSREGHCVSADTYKAVVARAALDGGAEIINDISGLTLGMGAAAEAARTGAGYVLNYSYSVPKQRPDTPPSYDDVAVETLGWMFERVAELEEAGLDRGSIAIDPGIAFGKSHDEDLQVLRRIGELRTPGLPLLLAHSRKNFIGSVTAAAPAERDLESHVVTAMAAAQGANIFRVHDPAGAQRAISMATAMSADAAGAYAPDGESWPWRAEAGSAHMTGAAPDKAAPPGQRW